MATRQEKAALEKLLDEIETVRKWFDDTAYPRRLRQTFEEALAEVKASFGIEGKDRVMPLDQNGTPTWTETLIFLALILLATAGALVSVFVFTQ